ncbi:hypothetical protein VUR80DRAFT_1169 [Thermomyces stellatus]
MKLYFVTLLIFLAATIYAAALDIDPAARALLKRAQEDINIVSTVLDNNLHRIDFYEDGKLEGYLLETEDGSVEAFDGEDNKVDIEELTDDGSLDKRGRFDWIKKLGPLFAQWGRAAWSYVHCVGSQTMLRCGQPFLDCAMGGVPLAACLEGHGCIGARAKECF